MTSGRLSTARLHHRYPPALVARLAWAMLHGRQRSFAPDAVRLYRTLRPPPQVQGIDHIPQSDSFVVVFNHYSSSSFPSWWGPIVMTALIGSRRPLGPRGISWVMTGAWTYPDPLRQRVLTPLSQFVFSRLAHTYGFVAMPPMPPRPHEVEARARAVRQVLALARRETPPLIGISPEGHDSPGAALMVPPPGVGRFLLQLAAAGLPFLPVGLHERGIGLIVRFGPLFRLEPPPSLPREARDFWAGEQVMVAIGRLLPPPLWGAYSSILAQMLPTPPYAAAQQSSEEHRTR